MPLWLPPLYVVLPSAAGAVARTVAAAEKRAAAEGLTLQRTARSPTGFKGVTKEKRRKSKPFQAQVWRGGRYEHLGYYRSAAEAALAYARALGKQVCALVAGAKRDRPADLRPPPAKKAARPPRCYCGKPAAREGEGERWVCAGIVSPTTDWCIFGREDD